MTFTLEAGGLPILCRRQRTGKNWRWTNWLTGRHRATRALPSNIFAFALPPGVRVVDIRLRRGEAGPHPGQAPADTVGTTFHTCHGQRFRKSSKRNERTGADHHRPQPLARGPRRAHSYEGGCRRYNVVQVRYTPIRCTPQSGELTLCPRLGSLFATDPTNNSPPSGTG